MNERIKIDITKASALWKSGSSIGVIADRYNVSRQTVAGVMYRNRDLFPKRSGEVLAISKATKTSRKHRPTYRDDGIPANAYDAGRIPFAKQLIDMSSCECRWPLNEGGPFLFCAEETAKGSPYCDHHAIRSLPKGSSD